MASLPNGWFVDRATGKGKINTAGVGSINGLVGGGVSSAPVGPAFSAASVSPILANLANGWFCDRAPGDGKPVFGMFGGIVPANGLVGGGGTTPAGPVGAGGKFYFEVTAVSQSPGQVSGTQLGFINPTQRDTIASIVVSDWHYTSNILAPAPPGSYFPWTGTPGGRCIWQGRNVDGAILQLNNNPAAYISNTIPWSSSGNFWATGEIMGVAVDTINNKFWMRNWMQNPFTAITAGWIGSGGDPAAGTGGFNLSSLTGDLLIYFGAPHLGTRNANTATLNAGATTFYGWEGTSQIPAGFVAWDATGATTWDQSAASGTGIVCNFFDTDGHINPSNGWLQPQLTNGRLTATIQTGRFNLTTGGGLGGYEANWSARVTYGLNAVTMDSNLFGGDGSIPGSIFIEAPGYSGMSLNDPIADPSWESCLVGVVSNSAKHRV